MCIYIAGHTFWPNARCQNYTRKHNHTHSHSHTHSTHMYAKQLARSLLVAGCVLFKILRHVNIKGPALSGSVPFGCEPPPPESEPSRVVPCVLGSRCCITPFDLSPTVRVCVCVCTRVSLYGILCVCVCELGPSARPDRSVWPHPHHHQLDAMALQSPSPCHSLPRPHRAAREISANVVFLRVVILNFLHMLVLPSFSPSAYPTLPTSSCFFARLALFFFPHFTHILSAFASRWPP